MNLDGRSALAETQRREVMFAGLAGFAELFTPAGARSAQVPIAEATGQLNPEEQALAFRKLAYSTGPQPGFWWLRGRRYGLVDNVLTPLWDMHVGVVFRTLDLPGGAWEVRSISTSFYTDIEKGTFLRTIRNPYTGSDIQIFYFPPAVAKARYQGLSVEAKTPPPGLSISDTVGAAQVDGSVLTIRSNHRISGTLANKPIQVNDLSTYVGAVKDLRDPTVAMAPASQTFNDFNSWPEWLQMGDRSGTYLSQAYGRKAFSLADMPPTWRRLLEEVHPEIAADPVRALGA